MTAIKNFRVDSFVSGLAIKAPVNVATDVPITLSGEQTVNLAPLTVGDRCLVKDQADPIENGIYTVETSAWQRAGDMDGSRDIVGGTVTPAYRVVDGVFVYYILAGAANILEPGTDALTFSVFYDPAVGGGVSLPISTDLGAILAADNAGGWVENTEIQVSGGFLLPGYVSVSDFLQLGSSGGTSKRITSTGNLEMVAQAGVGSVSVIGGSNFQVIQGGSIYIEEKAAANLDLVGYGQFWTRDDAPGQTPMWTGDDGVDYALNAAPSFAAPLVLLDDEEIEFGTSADVKMRWTNTGLGGGAGFIVEPLAASQPLALTGGQQVRWYNPLGSGYVQMENVGLLSTNLFELTKVGGTSSIDYAVGAWQHNDNRFLTPVLDDYAIQHATAGSVANVLDIDFEDGNSHYLALTENVTTMTLSNPPVSGRLGQVEIEILQDTVARTIAWPASVQWPGGTAPDLTTVSSKHLVHLRTRDGGTTYLGTFLENFS